MNNKNLIEENKKLKDDLDRLNKQFQYYYKSNKEKVEDNYRLRAELKRYKKEVNDLTLLLSVKIGKINANVQRNR